MVKTEMNEIKMDKHNWEKPMKLKAGGSLLQKKNY